MAGDECCGRETIALEPSRRSDSGITDRTITLTRGDAMTTRQSLFLGACMVLASLAVGAFPQGHPALKKKRPTNRRSGAIRRCP